MSSTYRNTMESKENSREKSTEQETTKAEGSKPLNTSYARAVLRLAASLMKGIIITLTINFVEPGLPLTPSPPSNQQQELNEIFKKLDNKLDEVEENIINEINEINEIQRNQESENGEDLSLVREAISELRQIKKELEQSHTRILAETNKEFPDTEQRQDRSELQGKLAQLETEMANLDAIERRIDASQEALTLLDPDRQQEFLKKLAEEAGNAALADRPLKHIGQPADSPDDRQQFLYDIENFLFLIHSCLIACRPNLLDRAIAEKMLPLSPLPAIDYIKAFRFIRDIKMPVAISSEAAKREVTVYLDYLIGVLSETKNLDS